MSELVFVVKSLILTAVIVMALQVQIGGLTVEARMDHWLSRSATAQWIQSAAAGGALAITRGFRSLKAQIDEKLGKLDRAPAEEQQRAEW